MDIVHRRVLTEKSKLGVGKYPNESVEKMLSINPRAIRWIYYNYEYIDFTPEVLEKAKIFIRLEKPAVNKIKFEDNEHIVYAKMTDEERLASLKEWSGKMAFRKRGDSQKGYARGFEQRTIKGKLQSINHGKASF